MTGAIHNNRNTLPSSSTFSAKTVYAVIEV